jgi:hypothetical protein
MGHAVYVFEGIDEVAETRSFSDKILRDQRGWNTSPALPIIARNQSFVEKLHKFSLDFHAM